MMDLGVFSYMPAFVHLSYVSEHVLARVHVCMFVVPSSPDVQRSLSVILH